MSEASALSDSGFRRYYVGSIAAMNATWIFRVLLTWMAWDMTHSASFVGLVAAATLLPVALTGPFFGALIDRANIKNAYRIVVSGSAACPAVLLVLLAMDVLTPHGLLAVSILYGLVLSAYHPVRQSLGPRLVGREMVGSVVALAALNFNVGRLLSPSIGGVLIGQVGLAYTALISVCLFIPAILIAGTLNPREPGKNIVRASYLDDLKTGLRVVWQRWPVRRSLLLTVFALGPVRATLELLSLIADGKFEQGAEGLGMLTSAVGGGALIAAIFQIVAGQRLLSRTALRYGFMALGLVAGLALVYAPSYPAALIAAPVMGFTGTYVGVSLQIGLQARLEDELRGRVMSLWMLSTTLSTSVLAVAMSLVSEVWGVSAATLTFYVCAAGAVAAIALVRSAD